MTERRNASGTTSAASTSTRSVLPALDTRTFDIASSPNAEAYRPYDSVRMKRHSPISLPPNGNAIILRLASNSPSGSPRAPSSPTEILANSSSPVRSPARSSRFARSSALRACLPSAVPARSAIIRRIASSVRSSPASSPITSPRSDLSRESNAAFCSARGVSSP